MFSVSYNGSSNNKNSIYTLLEYLGIHRRYLVQFLNETRTKIGTMNPKLGFTLSF